MMNIQYYGHPDDEPLNSSLNEMIGFKNNHCWKDVENWINERIDFLKDRLITAKTMEEVIALQSSIKQLHAVLEVPDLFIQELEAINEEQSKDED